MRLWSIHPKYLDRIGLLALWRESLLAQKVLSGKTKGYRFHPQLKRFKDSRSPLSAIGLYLRQIYKEGQRRGYKFSKDKISSFSRKHLFIKVSKGQLDFEISHLLKKLKSRDKKRSLELLKFKKVKPHPLFKVIEGSPEEWEKF